MKKRDRVKSKLDNKMGFVWGGPYKLISAKGISKFVEVLFDDEDHLKEVNIEDLEVVTDDKKLYVWDIVEEANMQDMICKMYEEAKEVEFELVVPVTTREKLASELLDLIQVCKHIAYKNQINLEDYIEVHNKKLEDRGHKIIC